MISWRQSYIQLCGTLQPFDCAVYILFDPPQVAILIVILE